VHTVLGAGSLDSPSAVALDSAGDLFVADMAVGSGTYRFISA
jgi:hypothetical protein